MFVLTGRRKGGDLLAFSPDGRSLAARSETGLQLWRDLAPGATATVFRDINSVASLRFTPDGGRLYFDGHRAGVIHLPTGGSDVFPPADGYRFQVLTADGRFIIAVHLPPSRGNFVDCRPAVNPGTGAVAWRVPLARAFGGRPVSLADGRFVLEEGEDRPAGQRGRSYRYVVRSGTTGAVLAEAPASDWFSERDAVSADGRWLAAQHTTRLRVWRLDDLAAPPVERDSGSKKNFTDLAFHPSGRVLAVSGNDGLVRYYDPETGQVARSFDWKLGKMVGVAFSPDGALAAAGTDTGRIVVWDVDV